MDWHDLIRRLRSRDLAARHEVYEAYQERLYAALFRLYPFATVHHADCIRDGMVDAFLEFFERPDSFDPARARSSDPLLAYLIGVARRRTIDHLRRLNPDALNHIQDEAVDPDDPDDDLLARRPGTPIGRSLDEIIADLDDGRITVNEFAEYVMLHVDSETVTAIFDRLNGRQREVILLKYLAEFTTKEIMDLLNLSEDAVENLLRRARDVLRVTLR